MLKKMYYLLIIVIISFPKINIISIGGSTTGIRIEDFLIAIFTLIYLLKILKTKKIVLKNKLLAKICKIYFAYFIVCIISTFFGICNGNVNMLIAIFYLARKLEYFILIFIGTDLIESKEDIKRVYKVLDISVIFHLIVIFLQSIGIVGSFTKGVLIEDISGGRFCSTFNGAYEFSAYLLLLLPYYLYNLMNEKTHKGKNLLFVLFILIQIYLSESRTSLILVILEIMIMMFIYNKSAFKKVVYAFLVIFAIFIVVSFTNFDLAFLPRFDTLNIGDMYQATKIAWESRDFDIYRNGINSMSIAIRYGQADLSYCIRVTRWMHLLDGFLKNPILGMGLSIVPVADGNYIRLLVETGILGLFLWLYSMISVIRNLGKSKYETIIKVATYSLLIGAIFIDVFDSSKIIMTYWFLLGAILQYQHIIRKDK